MIFLKSLDFSQFKRLQQLCLVLFLLTPTTILANDYNPILLGGTTLTFQQKNLKNDKIIGSTTLHYSNIQEGEKHLTLETSTHKNTTGILFATTEFWFDATTGKPIKSVEKNLENDDQSFSDFSDHSIQTTMIRKGKTTRYTSPRSSDIVHYSLLINYLRLNLKQITQKKRLKFRLFLPFLIPQLKKMGLPPQFSTLKVQAKLKGNAGVDVSSQKIIGAHIRVAPESPLITQLLPKEHRKLSFTISYDAPHYLLEAKAGGKRLTLIKIDQS